MKGQRTLFTWYLNGQLSEYNGKVDVANHYYLVVDYKPVSVIVTAKVAPTGATLVVDINANGTSLFSTNPNLSVNSVQFIGHTFLADGTSRLGKGSVLTLDVDAVGSGESGANLTVQLELEEL